MPLIESPRHTARDLEHWRRLELYDRVLARSAALERKEQRALEVLRMFGEAPCFVFVSWGKDSVVVADLVIRAGLPALMVWSRIDPYTNPDSLKTRDAFLSCRDARYLEARIDCPGEAAGHDDDCVCLKENLRRNIGVDYFAARHVSGVRAEESTPRRLRLMRWGESTERACAPIARWTGADVFAYLCKHGLPIHPAYACTFGGALDRARVRVDDLGGDRGTGRGRDEWERHYYRDEIERLEAHNATP